MSLGRTQRCGQPARAAREMAPRRDPRSPSSCFSTPPSPPATAMRAKAPACLLAACLAAAAASAALLPPRLGQASLRPEGEPPLRHSDEAEECHRVKSLPGWGSLGDLRLYSGLLPVSKDAALFHATVEAERKKSKAPVVLWLTGGPGCSSIGTAFLGEHGPLFPRLGSTSQLMRNHWSFHSLPATMIYLDAPAFVGFSYSNSSDDKEVGDKRMAKDVLSALKEWRKLFPKLAGNPFWLAGESYAGHYIPHLALRLLEHNANAVASEKIDFRGFLLGNPSTDPEFDNVGRLTYWWSHGLISEDVKREVEDSCDFNEVIITPSIEVKTRKESKACKKAVEDAISEMGPINIMNVMGNKCLDFEEEPTRSFGGWLREVAARWLGGRRRRHEMIDPCISKEAEAYLQRRDVQDALHANLTGLLDWEYQGCTEGEIFKYSVDDQLDSMLPLYRELMEKAPKLRILIYTGDADGMVPLTGTRKWVFELGTEEGKKQKAHWRHWEDHKRQVGGFLEEYEGFTFATIRGAGHEAPYTAKDRTFFVYRTWLAGEDIV